MLEIATKANEEQFKRGELATESTIDHDMGAVEFMVFCDTHPLPILCECGCPSVSDHNAKAREEHGA